MVLRTVPFRIRLGLGIAVVACLVDLGCASSPPAPPAPPAAVDAVDAVARFQGGWVTRAQVERQLGDVPRTLDPAQDPWEWAARRAAWREILVRKWGAELEGSRRFQLALRGAERRVAVEALVEDLAVSVEVPAQEVDAALEVEREQAALREESLRVRHLFLRADPTMSEAERAAQRALAGELLDRLRAGESFEQLAREYSQSETASSGGLLGGLRRGNVDPAFAKAAFALHEGQVSEVVTTARGYHLILLEERFTPGPFDEGEARSRIVQELRRRAVRQQRAELVARLESAGGFTAGWDEGGQLHADDDGVVLRVGDLEVTADEVELLQPPVVGLGRLPRSPVQLLQDTLESELLCREALERGLVSRDDLARERARAAGELVRRMAEEREVEELRLAVTQEDLERFALERPDLTSVPGEVRVRVMLLGFAGGQGYDTSVRALDLARRARQGESFVELVRRHSVGPNAEQGGDSGFVSPGRLGTLGSDFSQAVGRLEVGGVTDPVRVPPSRLGPLRGQYEGAFALAQLVERRPDRPLDPVADGEELRRRYWASERDRVVEARVREELATAGFELLVTASGAAGGRPGTSWE